MACFSQDVIDNALENCGTIVLKTKDSKYYFLTTNKNILRHIYVFGKLQKNENCFEALNVKTLIISSFEYNSIEEIYLICVPQFYSPSLVMRGIQDNKEIIDMSINILEKFRKIDKTHFSDSINTDILNKVIHFINSNKKLNNLFNLNIDDIDEKILSYEGGVCNLFYQTYKNQINFLSLGMGIMLEFFDKSVLSQFLQITDNKDEVIKLARQSWYTLLCIYREKSLKIYNEDIEKLQEKTNMTEFEKEYLLSNLKNEKERIKSIDFLEYLNLIEDPNFLIKYWPFTNISLESSDSIISNLGTKMPEEVYGDNRPQKNVILGNDYLFKLLKIIKQYLPSENISKVAPVFSMLTCNSDSLSDNITDTDKNYVTDIRYKLVEAKKQVLRNKKTELIGYLTKEKLENEEQDIKNEIQEIIDIVNGTEKDIDSLSVNMNVVDLLEFWPAALYPIPDDLDINK